MKVVVRDSPIHGRGVFAARRIEAGEVVIEGCRTRLTDDEVRGLPPEERPFVSVADGQSILMQPPSRFVNHSCNPNARGSEYRDVAVRAIEAGDEVTVDYADEVSGLTLDCNCKAANCRGRI
jgi:SET domain-containing protein